MERDWSPLRRGQRDSSQSLISVVALPLARPPTLHSAATLLNNTFVQLLSTLRYTLPFFIMSAANSSTVPQKASEKGKGKSKAADDIPGHDMSMEDDDDSSDEESGVEDVSSS